MYFFCISDEEDDEEDDEDDDDEMALRVVLELDECTDLKGNNVKSHLGCSYSYIPMSKYCSNYRCMGY